MTQENSITFTKGHILYTYTFQGYNFSLVSRIWMSVKLNLEDISHHYSSYPKGMSLTLTKKYLLCQGHAAKIHVQVTIFHCRVEFGSLKQLFSSDHNLYLNSYPPGSRSVHVWPKLCSGHKYFSAFMNLKKIFHTFCRPYKKYAPFTYWCTTRACCCHKTHEIAYKSGFNGQQ